MYQICIQRLNVDGTLDIEKVFSKFAHLANAALLDSGNKKHPNANFDIIVAEPVATINVQNSSYQSEQTGIDAFSLIEKKVENAFSEHQVPETHLPFLVGALGYAAYDYGRNLERLPESATDDYKAEDLIVGIYSWSIIKDKKANVFYYCYSNKYPHPTPEELEDLKENDVEDFALREEWQSNMSESLYREQFAKVHEYLKAGDSYQVNLAQRFTAKYRGDEWTAYQALKQCNQAPFSAFLRYEQHTIVSCSPERFLQCHEGLVETKPIKGTRPRSKNPERDELIKQELLSSEKDRAENLMIVDLLRNDLSKNCQPHSVKVEALFAIESFPAVHHLVSTITGQLKPNKTALSLLRDAFPGGSITGAPKVRSMEIIEELEPHRRHIYCGSIFYYGVRADMDSNICIRTVLFENKKVKCWAGGGLVMDSKAESEYQETFDKVNKILPTLARLK